jgi:FkbM family methyltransferase
VVRAQWKKFDTPLIRKAGLTMPTTPNEYGMTLQVNPDERHIRVRSKDALAVIHTHGGQVPGGHRVLAVPGRKPFVSQLKECHSIELRHSDVVVDIGAYVGTYAIRCARFPVKAVTAYEPTPQSYGVLSKTTLPNLTVVQAAIVGDRRRSVTLHIARGIGTTNSTVKSARKIDHLTVPAVSYVRAVKQATIVKIDIEGGEYDLPIVQPSIRALIIDFHPVDGTDWMAKAARLMQTLKAAGFKAVIAPDLSHPELRKSARWREWYARASGSWIRDRETSGECRVLMRGKACCGCGVVIDATAKALCRQCFRLWSKRHREGFLCA